MKITRFLGVAAAAAMTTGVLVAVAVPASGQELLNPDMVPAMQRDLGLSHDQAIARLRSEDVASKVTEAVSVTLGEAFGGATYNAATGKAHIEVADAALIGKIREAGAEAEVVKFSSRQLDSTVDKLNAGEKAAPAAVTGWKMKVEKTRKRAAHKGSGSMVLIQFHYGDESGRCGVAFSARAAVTQSG